MVTSSCTRSARGRSCALLWDPESRSPPRLRRPGAAAAARARSWVCGDSPATTGRGEAQRASTTSQPVSIGLSLELLLGAGARGGGRLGCLAKPRRLFSARSAAARPRVLPCAAARPAHGPASTDAAAAEPEPSSSFGSGLPQGRGRSAPRSPPARAPTSSRPWRRSSRPASLAAAARTVCIARSTAAWPVPSRRAISARPPPRSARARASRHAVPRRTPPTPPPAPSAGPRPRPGGAARRAPARARPGSRARPRPAASVRL